MTDPTGDPTGLGIRRPITTPVVPVAETPAAASAPVELPTAFVRPVVPAAAPVRPTPPVA